ncbi:MAG TPA: thioredoxin [Phycisphaerales bacterium]|nr:thioredoxin [Phycisphaerales bacterium]
MAGNVIELTDAEFDKTLNEATGPVLVDFWAPWCGPCKMIGPVIEELAGEYAGKATFCKVNTDDHRDAAIEYQVSAIPTLILFKDGQVAHRWTGLTAKKDLKAKIDEVLAE